jgi:two-component system chemotaxis response regulator CheY
MPDPSLPVLVIDDFATMTRIMTGLLNQIGFQDVDACLSGEEALGKLASRRYGLILCDLEMDPMTGAEFARRVRAGPPVNDCPILLTTASRESAAQCVRDGVHELVNGFILKPFTPADLQVKLAEIDEKLRLKKRQRAQEPLIEPADVPRNTTARSGS